MARWDNSDTRVAALTSTECCVICISIAYSGRSESTASNSTKLYSNPTPWLRGVQSQSEYAALHAMVNEILASTSVGYIYEVLLRHCVHISARRSNWLKTSEDLIRYQVGCPHGQLFCNPTNLLLLLGARQGLPALKQAQHSISIYPYRKEPRRKVNVEMDAFVFFKFLE